MNVKRNDEWSEQWRKYAPRTDMGTLLRLRPVLKQVGLDGFMKDGKMGETELVSGVIQALANAAMLNEFCQIISGRNDIDFMNDEGFGTVAWLVHDFFADMWWSMPPSWRAEIAKAMKRLERWGMERISGMIPPTSSTANE